MRRFPASLTALLAAVSVLVLAACGSVSSYAASVDGERISQDELEGEMRSIASNEQYLKTVEARQTVRGTGKDTFDATFTALALTRQIFYVLIDKELERRKLEVGPDDLSAARALVVEQLQGEEVLNDFPKSYQDQLVRRQAQLDVLTVALNGQKSADDAARAYYDANKDQFTRACVRHVLVETQEQAEATRRKLVEGQDFAAVAKSDSKDSQSAAKGGELGCDVTRDTQYVPEFLLAVFSQGVGEVGQPVKTQFGFHVIRVDSKTTPPYEEVTVEARDKVRAAGQDKVLAFLQERVQSSEIDVNPKYGTFQKTGNSPGVVPPQAPDTTAGEPAPGPAPAPPGGGARP